MHISYKQLLLGELVASEVLQVILESRSRVRTRGVSLGGGGNCWKIGRLSVSINSPCVRCGRLGECTIRLGYAPFLQAIAFRRVGCSWGPTVTYWTRPTINHDVNLSYCHDSPSYYIVWTLNLEMKFSLCWINRRLWFMDKILKWSNIPYRFGHYWYWWRLVAIGILNRDTMISHKIEIACPFEWSKRHVIMKYIVALIHLVEFDICSLGVKYVSWSHNR